METERFFSGYCRCVDGSRTVCVIAENGALTEVDCNYETCPYSGSCTIAKEIYEMTIRAY